MGRPVCGSKLVPDQQIGGFGVRHPQKRLGQAEQGNAFLGVQPVLLEEAIDPTLALRRAQVGEKQTSLGNHRLPGPGMQLRTVQKSHQNIRLGHPVQVPHGGAVASKSHGGCAFIS